MLASANGRSDTVQRLLKTLDDADAATRLAVINHADNEGRTALIAASQPRQIAGNSSRHLSREEIVKLLLATGARVDANSDDSAWVKIDVNIIYDIFSNQSSSEMPIRILHDMPQQDVQSFFHRCLETDHDTCALSQLICWAIISDRHHFVRSALSAVRRSLNLGELTEYLRLALHANRVDIANTLLEFVHGEDSSNPSKTAVCNYLLHLMVIECAPPSVINFLLQHGAVPKPYTRESCEEDQCLLKTHTLFQKKRLDENISLLPSNDIVKENVGLRQSLWRNDQTLFHAACYSGNHLALKTINEYGKSSL